MSQVLPQSTSTLSTKELGMSPNNPHSAFMAFIQDDFSIQSASINFGTPPRQIKDLISKFEYSQQDIISKKNKNLSENRNQNHISQCSCALIHFKPRHQSYTDWEMKCTYCARILLNLYYRYTTNKYGVPKSTFNEYIRKIYPLLI